MELDYFCNMKITKSLAGRKDSVEIAKNDMVKNIRYVDSLSLFQALIMEPSIDLKEYVA